MTADAIEAAARDQADEGPFGPFLSEQERDEYNAYLAATDSGVPQDETQPSWVDDFHEALPTGPDDPCPLCGKPLGDEQNVHWECADHENRYSDWVAEQMGKDDERD